MLENNDRFPLQEIIMEDLFTSNKLVLLLLLAITISALGTVWITHQTRGLVAEKGDVDLVVPPSLRAWLLNKAA